MSGDDPERACARAPRDPEELEAQAGPSDSEISTLTTIGPVSLTISDLARSVSYYQAAVGQQLIEQGDGLALLGAGARGLLRLTEVAGARPSGHHTGLYHFALLLERRAKLARCLAHAAHDRVALVGLSDHFVSEALYLSDPDGHGVEIYWDRPLALCSPPPPDEATLRHLTIVAPHQGEREPLAERLSRRGHAPQETEAGLVARDPSGNQVVLAVPTDVGSG